MASCPFQCGEGRKGVCPRRRCGAGDRPRGSPASREALTAPDASEGNDGSTGEAVWALCGAGWVAPEPAAPLPSAQPDPALGRSAALSWGSPVASGAPASLPGLCCQLRERSGPRWWHRTDPVGWASGGVGGRGGRGAGGGRPCVGSAGHLCHGEQPFRGPNTSVPLQAFLQEEKASFPIGCEHLVASLYHM